jgi:small subunit ribosomal protein S17
MNRERGKKQLQEGTVVKDNLSVLKMKTVTVQVERQMKHRHVLKYVRRFKRYLVHDEKSECRKGDRVQIVLGRPVSKKKRWKVSQILEKAQ